MANRSGFYFESYAEWRHALTNRCGINLTQDYARSRIAALRNPNDPHTKEFTTTYGDAYLSQVIQWFEQAERER